MTKIAYKAKLSELLPLVETTEYDNPELAEDLLKHGVTTPITLTSSGVKSRFGMKKITVKDGKKRLNLAATDKKIAKLTAQVILLDDSFENVLDSEPLSRKENLQPVGASSSSGREGNVYRWKNEKRNLLECCTPKELGQKYGIRIQYIHTLLQGKVKSTRGWTLA